MKLIATIACLALILGLFFLDRDKRVRSSKALWIPLIWYMIIGSRAVSKWWQSDSLSSLANELTEGSPIDAAIYGMLIFVAVLVLNYRSRLVKRFLQANAPILLFFIFCALSILWSDFPLVALKRWIKAIGDFVMVLVVLTDPDPLAAIKWLFTRAAFILLPLSVLFIAYYPNLGTLYDPTDRITYYIGVATQKNEIGQTCMVCGLVSLWALLGAWEDHKMPHRQRHLLANALMVITAAGLIIRANSMTSLACLGLAGAVLVLSARPWFFRQTGTVHMLVSIAVGIPTFAAFLDSSGALLQSLGRNATLTGRTLVWKTVLGLHTNPLIGTGFESFWLGSRLHRVWELAQQGLHEALNGFLEIYLTLGYVGLILLGWLILAGYSQAFRDFRRNPFAGRLRLAFFTSGLIYSLTEASFHFMTPAWIAFLLAMTCVPRDIQVKRSQGSVKPPLSQTASVPKPQSFLRRSIETL